MKEINKSCDVILLSCDSGLLQQCIDTGCYIYSLGKDNQNNMFNFCDTIIPIPFQINLALGDHEMTINTILGQLFIQTPFLKTFMQIFSRLQIISQDKQTADAFGHIEKLLYNCGTCWQFLMLSIAGLGYFRTCGACYFRIKAFHTLGDDATKILQKIIVNSIKSDLSIDDQSLVNILVKYRFSDRLSKVYKCANNVI